MKCKILFVIVFAFISNESFCEKDRGMFMDNDFTSLYLINPNKNNGFEMSMSAVFMFTVRVRDRSGFRCGLGFTFAKRFGDIRFSLGCDFYKAKQNNGIGTSLAGVGYFRVA